MTAVVSAPVDFAARGVFVASPVTFAGRPKDAEAGHWITVGEGAEAHHLFLPAGGFAALKREKLAPGETHHIVSGGKAYGDSGTPKVGQTFFHAGSKQYLTTVRTDSHSIGPAERTGYGLQQNHAVAHHVYARPATEEEAAPHRDAEAAKAKLVGADVLRDALKQRFRKTGREIGEGERVDDPQPGKPYQLHVGSAFHLDDRATDFIPHARQQKRDNDGFYVTPTRTALLDATNNKKYVLPTTTELIGHIASIENIRAEGQHDLATAYDRKDETERRVRQSGGRELDGGRSSVRSVFSAIVDFIAPSVTFKDYPFGPGEGHWVTIDGEHVLIRGVHPGKEGGAGGTGAARDPGYSGTPEGLIHPDAPAVRFKLLDAAAPHEAGLAEHDKAIAEHSGAIKAAARDSDRYSDLDPRYHAAMDTMVRHEEAQAMHMDAKKAVGAAMDKELRPLLQSPTLGAVTAQSFTKLGAPQAQQAVEAFNRLVPASVASGTANFRQSKVRANYQPTADRITLAKDSAVRVGVHELGHWLERHNSDVSEKARAFLAHRTNGEVPQPLSKLTNVPGYGATEVARPDKFQHPYMGKQYGTQEIRETLPGEDSYRYSTHTPTEIMSMGLEQMTNARDAVAFAKADPEMFDFIISTARGMHKK